jgi:hypothetical protein
LTAVVTAVAGFLAVAPAHAYRPYYLGGTWVNSADPASSYQLVPSSDLKTMNMSWHGIGAHSSLVGTFTGALHGLYRYQGTFQVTEGSVVVNGTGTVTVDSIGKKTAGYPPLSVRLLPDSGGETDITLEIWIANPEVIPNAPKVEFDFNCPGTEPCGGVDQGVYTGGAMSPDLGGAAAGKQMIVAESHFMIQAGHTRKLVLSLNKLGRKLLAKHGSLRIRIRVTVNKSFGLPHATTVGTVTFHKK